MTEKPTIPLPVVRPTIIVMSSDPRGDAVLLVLPMAALFELEALLAKASQEQAKSQPVQ